MKEEQESSRQATQESAAGQTRTTAEKRGEDTGWGSGQGQPGVSLILDGLAVRFFPHELIMDGVTDGLACPVFSS